MTMVAQGLQAYPIPFALSSPATSTIDAADEIAGSIIPIAKAGNIRAVHWRTATVTTGATVTVGAVTVDGSGQLTTTPWGTNTNNTHVVADGNDNVWLRTAFTADAVVAAGDNIGIVVKNPAATFGNIQIYRGASIGSSFGFPYPLGPLETNKVDLSGPGFVLEYDDGTFHLSPLATPFVLTGVTLSTGTNPDEIALIYTEMAKRRLIGWWANMSVAAGADYRLALYASGNNTPLLTKTMDGDQTSSAGQRLHTGYFTGSQVTTVGTTYRLALVPLTASNITLRYADAPASYPTAFNTIGIPGSHYSARNRSSTTDPDSASWTETTDRLPQLGLLYDQVDDGAGSGGGGGKGDGTGMFRHMTRVG